MRTVSASQLVQLLDSGIPIRLLVTGRSMSPTLADRRDAVVLLPPRSPIPRGAIVLAQRGGRLILHRVIRLCPDGRLLLRGDAQRWTELIHPSQVCGIVCAVVRRGTLRRTDSLGFRFWSTLGLPLFRFVKLQLPLRQKRR